MLLGQIKVTKDTEWNDCCSLVSNLEISDQFLDLRRFKLEMGTIWKLRPKSVTLYLPEILWKISLSRQGFNVHELLLLRGLFFRCGFVSILRIISSKNPKVTKYPIHPLWFEWLDWVPACSSDFNSYTDKFVQTRSFARPRALWPAGLAMCWMNKICSIIRFTFGIKICCVCHPWICGQSGPPFAQTHVPFDISWGQHFRKQPILICSLGSLNTNWALWKIFVAKS